MPADIEGKKSTTVEVKNKDVFPHFFAASLGTTGAHPLRVCLNRAPYHLSPLSVLKDLPYYWHSGLFINLTRGMSVITLQSWANQQVQYVFTDQHSSQAKLSGISAAAIAGTTVASIVETALIRKNTLSKNLQGYPLIRFAPALTGAYFFREFGFGLVVLGSKDSSPTAYYSKLISLSFLTAACHKFAVWEATPDIMKKMNQGTVPNITQDGLRETVKNMAQGKYTHPSCKVPRVNPVTSTDLLVNFLTVSCGANMFIYRVAYLWAVQKLMNVGKDYAPIAKNKMNFWFETWNDKQRLTERDDNKLQLPTKKP